MTSRIPSLRVRLAALLVPLAITPGALRAQGLSGYSAAATPAYPAIAEADPVAALSRYLRMLAANPRDLASLTGAGRAALAVGDANAALGFYARAEEIAPRNGRIKAGLASALVQMEQPRTALKLFDEATALGVPAGDIAADRGLANDLNGDNRKAQADYTLALRTKDDDETLRRLALSMAISGDRAGALTMLDPLLRKRDSGAARARAFVLALTGDQAGAANAVRTAMPGPQAAVMAKFMSRLGTLNPAQKALAVNFGYFPSDGRSYTAAELFADARSGPRPAVGAALPARDPRADARSDTPLIPAGEALGPAIVTASNDAGARAPRRRPGQGETPAEVLPPAHVLSAPIPGQTPPPASAPVRVGMRVQPAAVGTTSVGGFAWPVAGKAAAPATRPTDSAPVQPFAGTAPRPTQVAAVAPPPAAAPAAIPVTGAGPVRSGETASAGADQAAVGPVAPAPTAPAATEPAAAAAGPAAPGTLVVTALGPALASGGAIPPTPAPATVATTDLPASAPPVASSRPEPAARVAMIEETAVRQAAARAPVAAPKPVAVKESASAGKADAKSRPGKADGKAAADGKSGKPDPKDKATTKLAASDKTGKAAAKDGKDAKGEKTKPGDKEAKGDTSSKDAKGKGKSGEKEAKADTSSKSGKGANDKPEAKEAGKSKIPERYWVQVASGSNKANLDKAWTNVKAKAPKLLDGKATYTAPWRASNRLLIGPFKTDEEAQAQVNKLAKAGVSGIQFTTRAGADVDRVTAR